MSNAAVFKIDPKLDLVLERMVDVSPEAMWAAWTKPDLIKKWFTPAPWTTVECSIDLKPGGLFATTMRSPDGQEFPNNGCYLEIVENEKLVFTDALTASYRPSEGGFFTAMILLERQGLGTKYTVVAMHKDEAGKKKHEAMGFHQGWGKALDQMLALIRAM